MCWEVSDALFVIVVNLYVAKGVVSQEVSQEKLIQL
jgi:hypothetical protein